LWLKTKKFNFKSYELAFLYICFEVNKLGMPTGSDCCLYSAMQCIALAVLGKLGYKMN